VVDDVTCQARAVAESGIGDIRELPKAAIFLFGEELILPGMERVTAKSALVSQPILGIIAISRAVKVSKAERE